MKVFVFLLFVFVFSGGVDAWKAYALLQLFEAPWDHEETRSREVADATKDTRHGEGGFTGYKFDAFDLNPTSFDLEFPRLGGDKRTSLWWRGEFIWPRAIATDEDHNLLVYSAIPFHVDRFDVLLREPAVARRDGPHFGEANIHDFDRTADDNFLISREPLFEVFQETPPTGQDMPIVGTFQITDNEIFFIAEPTREETKVNKLAPFLLYRVGINRKGNVKDPFDVEHLLTIDRTSENLLEQDAPHLCREHDGTLWVTYGEEVLKLITDRRLRWERHTVGTTLKGCAFGPDGNMYALTGEAKLMTLHREFENFYLTPVRGAYSEMDLGRGCNDVGPGDLCYHTLAFGDEHPLEKRARLYDESKAEFMSAYQEIDELANALKAAQHVLASAYTSTAEGLENQLSKDLGCDCVQSPNQLVLIDEIRRLLSKFREGVDHSHHGR